MKLKESFISYDSDKESFLVPTGAADFAGVVKGNKTLGVIVELLKSETTEVGIIDAMCERFEAPRELIARDVKIAVENLRKIGALDE